MSTSDPTIKDPIGTIRRILCYAVPYIARILVVVGVTAVYTACLTLRLALIGLLVDGVLLAGFGSGENSLAIKGYRAIAGAVGTEVRLTRTYEKQDPFTLLRARGEFTRKDEDKPYVATEGDLVDLWLPGAEILPGARGNGGFDRPFIRMEIRSPDTVRQLPDGVWEFTNGELTFSSGDILSLKDRENYIRVFCVLAVILALAIGASSFAKDYFSRKVYLRIAADIRQDIYNHLSRQSVAFFDRQKSGDLISRTMNDAGLLQTFLHNVFDNFLEQPFTVVFSLGMAFAVHPIFTLICLPFMLGLFFPVWRAGRRVKRHGKGRMEQMGVVTEAIHQLFTGIRILKAFGMEEQERQAFAEKNRRYIRVAMKMEKAKITSRCSLEMLYNLGIAAAVLGVGYLIAQDPSDLGNFGIFLGALFSIYMPLKRIARAYNSLQETFAGAERVFEILDQKPDIRDLPGAQDLPAISSKIEFQHVSFYYSADEGELPVLRDIDFGVGVGAVIGIVGPSGAGKTTLVDLIPRFYEPQEGCIRIDGVDTTTVTQKSLLRQIAIVGQDPFLFNSSVRNNLLFGRQNATDDELIDAARKANIYDVIAAMPQGFDTEIGERGAKLSGGERQRLTIARAILKDAPILILDEATSALDSESERLVQDALQNLMQNRLTFLIAHRLSTLVFADRILVIENGIIVESGTHDELLAQDGTYRRLYRLQHPEGDGENESNTGG